MVAVAGRPIGRFAIRHRGSRRNCRPRAGLQAVVPILAASLNAVEKAGGTAAIAACYSVTRYPVPITSGFAVGFANASLSTIIAGGPISGGSFWLFQVTVQVAGFMTTNSGEIQCRAITINSFTNEGQGTPPYGGGIIGSLSAMALICDIRNY